MISKRTRNFFENYVKKAAHLGQLSNIPSHKIGSILVHKKSIIATGYNKRKSHPLQQRLNQLRAEGKRNRTYLHAEVDCIGNLKDVPSGSTLFIGRFDLNGKYGMCRPCEACMACIRQKGVKEIVYTTTEGYAVEQLL